MKIGIIIINYNNSPDTIKCLDSISRYLIKHDITVVLIDNKSADPLGREIVNAYDFEIDYIINEENLGFAEGNNVGLRRALTLDCDYMVLLNNDTILVDDSLIELINLISHDERIGIGGMVNYYFSDESKIWQAGFLNNFKSGKPKAISDFNPSSKELIFADYVPGSSFVIKKSVIQKIGLLDSRYFAYYEENDFCTRAAKFGYKTAFLANSKILHKVGASSDSVIKLYLRTRNKLVFYKKFSSGRYFMFIFMKLYFKSFIRIIFSYKDLNNTLRYQRALHLAYSDYFNQNLFIGHLSKL